MFEMPKKEYNSRIYRKMTEEQRKRNIQNSAKYLTEHYQRFSLRIRNEVYPPIGNYMNYCIDSKLCNGKNDFFLNAVKYAINNDFMNINDEIGVNSKIDVGDDMSDDNNEIVNKNEK